MIISSTLSAKHRFICTADRFICSRRYAAAAAALPPPLPPPPPLLHMNGASESCQWAERTKKEDRSKVTPGIQVLFWVEAVIVDPPNHISISPEAYGLDSCDQICYLLPNIEQFMSTYVSCLELIVSVHWHLTPHFCDKCWYLTFEVSTRDFFMILPTMCLNFVRAVSLQF